MDSARFSRSNFASKPLSHDFKNHQPLVHRPPRQHRRNKKRPLRPAGPRRPLSPLRQPTFTPLSRLHRPNRRRLPSPAATPPPPTGLGLRRRLQNQVMPAMVYAPPDTRQRLDNLLAALASLLASGPPGHSPQAPPGHPPDKPKTRGPGRRSRATCQPSSRGHPPEAPLSPRPREAASPLAKQKPP